MDNTITYIYIYTHTNTVHISTVSLCTTDYGTTQRWIRQGRVRGCANDSQQSRAGGFTISFPAKEATLTLQVLKMAAGSKIGQPPRAPTCQENLYFFLQEWTNVDSGVYHQILEFIYQTPWNLHLGEKYHGSVGFRTAEVAEKSRNSLPRFRRRLHSFHHRCLLLLLLLWLWGDHYRKPMETLVLPFLQSTGRLMQQDSIGFQAVSSMPKMRLQYMGGRTTLWKPSYHNDLQDDKP